MTYVVTQNCCNDASCVPVCPVGCIHPTPDEPGYASAEMLYIDPGSCIDCGACVDACPVGAIKAADQLAPHQRQYADINAAYFLEHEVDHRPAEPPPLRTDPVPSHRPIRVAVVGAGPAGFYAAEELLATSPVPVEISMLDRLPTPFGLVRAGVAPDHQPTKDVDRLFRWVLADPRVTSYFNLGVGEHVAHQDLVQHHHAVIYTHGASTGRTLGIPGEQLRGSFSSTEVVGWYNGHPDHAHHRLDLSTPRVVVIGNGNVALDLARLLLTDPEQLAATDIADHALDALRGSRVREVVLLGRRDARDSAFTTPELLALEAMDIDIDIEGAGLDETSSSSFSQRLKLETLRRIAARTASGRRRLVLRYLSPPTEVVGDGHVSAVRVGAGGTSAAHDDGRTTGPAQDGTLLETGLVISAVGYQGEPLDGLPFDDATRTIPHSAGRVLHGGAALPGVYVAGWIKRGATGVIGSNRLDARETVASVLADLAAGSLPEPPRRGTDFDTLVQARNPATFDRSRWQALDHHERRRGQSAGRPRLKVTTTSDMLALTAEG